MDLHVQNLGFFCYFGVPQGGGRGGSLPLPKSRYDRTRETVAKIFVTVPLAGLLHPQDSDKDLRHCLAGGIIAPARQ